MRDFIQQLFANSVDGRSVGRKLSALRHLYRYLLLDKIIEHDPTLNIDSPKQWKVLPKSAGSRRDGCHAAKSHSRPWQGSRSDSARDHAMLEVFYASALRVSEITGVKLEDLKLDLGCILVRGKGRQGTNRAAGQRRAGCIDRLHQTLSPGSRQGQNFTASYFSDEARRN